MVGIALIVKRAKDIISSRVDYFRRVLDSNVHFADGTGRNLTDSVVPLIIPSATELQTFLRQWRRHWIQIGVATCTVVQFTAAPVGVLHLRHTSSAAARSRARSLLPDERRLSAVQVVALSRCPEHLFTTVDGIIASASRNRRVYNVSGCCSYYKSV